MSASPHDPPPAAMALTRSTGERREFTHDDLRAYKRRASDRFQRATQLCKRPLSMRLHNLNSRFPIGDRVIDVAADLAKGGVPKTEIVACVAEMCKTVVDMLDATEPGRAA